MCLVNCTLHKLDLFPPPGAARGISAGVKPHAGGPLEAPAGAAARCGMSPCPRVPAGAALGSAPSRWQCRNTWSPSSRERLGLRPLFLGESLALEILLDVCSISNESFTMSARDFLVLNCKIWAYRLCSSSLWQWGGCAKPLGVTWESHGVIYVGKDPQEHQVQPLTQHYQGHMWQIFKCYIYL